MRDIDSDEEDFVFVGTPIEREEDVSSRKKKAVAEASSQLRTLPSWKQEVRDEEGRRRFHGAFTGGYSAGFYNTVGSKEGWAPQSFTSSRKSRAEAKKQSILDFLDEDEKEEMGGQLVGTSSQFDTFGFTAADLARKQAEKEQKQRPSAIPGPVPDELVIPAAESIGVKLLLKMGWRHGRSIKDSSIDSLHEARREARKAFLALSSAQKVADVGGSESKIDSDESMVEPATDGVESSHGTPIYVRQPKQDLYGLGFDPYKHAPEFREMKRSRMSGNKELGFRKPFSSRQEPVTAKSGRLAPGFGIGALEEMDVEDEDIYSSAHNYVETYVPNDDDEPSRLPLDDEEKTAGVDRGAVPRFSAASNSEYQLERFDPPIVPNDFVLQHKFPPVDTNNSVNGFAPPEVPPPHDNNLKVMIEGVAALVARCGKLFEDISREKNRSNPLFSFLYGGSGQDYYARKLWEAQQKCKDKIRMRPDEKLYSTVPKMTAENRGKILGERPLDRTLNDSSSKAAVADDDVHVPSNSSDTFTKPEVLGELFEAAKPFKDDPAKQERFEQFVKDKYQGGLRATDSGKSTFMSEAARARERLDFEAAAEAIEKTKLATQSKLPDKQSVDFTLGIGMQFTSGGVEDGRDSSAEELISKKYPQREEFQWRPAPLLCKRFDIVDPYMGKPPPAPRMRGKLGSLVFTPDSAKNMKTEDRSLMLPKSNDEPSMDLSSNEAEDAVEIENIERPVDLFKAIFSDDSDNDEDASKTNPTEDPQKKTEAASAAFSRIVAGDFLESLGKELGLEVPPDAPPATAKAGTPVADKEATQVSRGTNMTAKNFLSSPLDGSATQEAPYNKISSPVVDNKDRVQEQSGKDVNNNVKIEKGDRRGKQEKHELRSSSSEDERSRKRSKKHHRRRSSSDDDDSDDSRGRHKSRSRDDKRRSSRKKHRRRKHSRH